MFDRPRHKVFMRLPLDYTRINQFPEWFTVQPDATYELSLDGRQKLAQTGAQLAEGVEVNLKAGEVRMIEAHRQ